MDDLRSVPASSAADEKSPAYAGPEDSTQPKTETSSLDPVAGGDATDLVDVPGVGVVNARRFSRAEICSAFGVPPLPEDRPCTVAGTEYVAGMVPQPLRDYVDGRSPFQPREMGDEERDRLIINLLFAAKRLVDRSVHPGTDLTWPRCASCFSSWPTGTKPFHSGACVVGQITDAIEALFAHQQRAAAQSVQSNPTGKESVAEKEQSLLNLNEAGPDGKPAQRIAAYGEPFELRQCFGGGYRFHDRDGFVHGALVRSIMDEVDPQKFLRFAVRVKNCLNFCANISDEDLSMLNQARSVADYGVRAARDVVPSEMFAERECPWCGEIDSRWTKDWTPNAEVAVEHLGRNQCVSVHESGVGYARWTHQCKGVAA